MKNRLLSIFCETTKMNCYTIFVDSYFSSPPSANINIFK